MTGGNASRFRNLWEVSEGRRESRFYWKSHSCPSILPFRKFTQPDNTLRTYEADGLYEQVVNELVGEAILEARKHGLDIVLRNLDSGNSHSYLAQYLTPLISSALCALPQPERTSKQIELVNKILLLLLPEAPESAGGTNVASCPYTFLGPGDYCRPQGSRPRGHKR